jgi:hypothetical protein
MARRSLSFAATLGVALLFGCGGGSPTPNAPGTPPPTTAAPAPTPQPPATAFDCGRTTFPAGPVTSYSYKLKSIRRGDETFQGPPEGDAFPTDAQGRTLVRVGDFLVFDSTQKNAAGNPSRWERDPVWQVTDPGGILRVRNDSSRETNACGFLLRVDALSRGTFSVHPVVDGVGGAPSFDLQDPLTLVVEP